MRCPKCQYLGFEPSPRCKNCGYDFAFSGDDLPSLSLQPVDVTPPAADLDLQLLDTTPAMVGGSTGLDRKSTRLNSSH